MVTSIDAFAARKATAAPPAQGFGDPSASIIYVIDSPEHPLDLDAPTRGVSCHVVRVPVSHWNDSLTPWPAPALHREDPPFGGKAAHTLAELERAVVAFESAAGLSPRRRAVMGYSLGGLFSLYAFARSELFEAAASVSGSLWYDGLVEWLEAEVWPDAMFVPTFMVQDGKILGTDVSPGNKTHPFVFLSVGSKEKRAAQPRVKLVEQRTREVEELLRRRGVSTQLVIGPGSHFQNVSQRLELAFGTLCRGTLSPGGCTGTLSRGECAT